MNTPDCGPYKYRHGNDPDQCASAALQGLDYFFTHELCKWYQGEKKSKKVRRKRLT